MTTRRALITCLASLLVSPAIVRRSSLMPVRVYRPRILGDGVHDDWMGLQAAIDNLPFEDLTGKVYRDPFGALHCSNLLMRLSRPLVIPLGSSFSGLSGDMQTRVLRIKSLETPPTRECGE